MKHDTRDGLALLILRLGLAWFIFLWAAHKIITPGQYAQLARHFDGVDPAFWQIYATGGAQVALCLLMALGLLRWVAYPALTVMHVFTVTRRWDGFFNPFALNDRGFPVNRNQVIDLAVLAAFVALILLMHRDRWSLGAWLTARGGKRWWH